MATPPVKQTPEALTWASLELLNTGGVITIKLVVSGSSTAFQLVRAAPPQNSGSRRMATRRYLGQMPAIVGGKSDITSLYTAKFGTPAEKRRLLARWQREIGDALK